ncbi:MAG: sugar ABC transporter permease [Clostridia bacterium]|nr:sugar ABC transporter permease [Clostridia bacterium]
MTEQNKELNNVPAEEVEVLNEAVQPVEEVEQVVETNPNLEVASALTKQNAARAREIVKERLAQMSPEQIDALRSAKSAKIEAMKPVEAPAPEISEEEKNAVKDRLSQMTAEQIAALQAAKAAKVEEAAALAAVEAASVVEEVAAAEVSAPVVAVKAPAKKKKANNRKGPRISYESKQAFSGFMFVLPWFLGFLLFFAIPCLRSLQFSFSKVSAFEQYKCTWIALDNYKEVLTTNATFSRALSATLTDFLINVPIVLIFSLFVAVLLNRKFPGRGLVRGIFFLPVIVTTGIVMSTFSHSDSDAAFSGNMNRGILFQMTDASEFLVELGLNATITEYMSMVADRIFDVVWNSGVQILLFLAALQGISPQLYEASSVEGATAWETFWLITFPNVAPVILVNIVYTIVDTYNNPDNKVLGQIDTLMNTVFNFGGAAAACWIFFVIILAILGVVFGVYALLTRKSR